MSQVPALEIRDLHTWYGESHILHGLNLQVQPGEVVTLLGRNGSGRTTTMRAIMGLTGTRKGSINISGQVNRTDVQAMRQRYLPALLQSARNISGRMG
jgi:ABC-type branched-subunit amino acid transport system ATPase component